MASRAEGPSGSILSAVSVGRWWFTAPGLLKGDFRSRQHVPQVPPCMASSVGSLGQREDKEARRQVVRRCYRCGRLKVRSTVISLGLLARESRDMNPCPLKA
jgi:hypothetical protein